MVRGVTSDEAVRIAQRIRRAVENAPVEMPCGKAHRVTISIGCAPFVGKTSFREMFTVADRLLYEAKAAGRNQVVAEAEADMKKAG